MFAPNQGDYETRPAWMGVGHVTSLHGGLFVMLACRVGGAMHRLLQSSSQTSLSRAGGGSRRNDELMDV